MGVDLSIVSLIKMMPMIKLWAQIDCKQNTVCASHIGLSIQHVYSRSLIKHEET